MEGEELLGETSNLFKLHYLVDYVTPELRKLLLEKWKMKLDREWDGSPASVSFLKEAIGQKEFERASVSVRRNIEEEKIEQWDMTTFSRVLRALNSQWVSDEEKERIEDADQIRYDISRCSNRIPQEEFSEMWQKLIDILSFLGVPEIRIVKIEKEIESRLKENHNNEVLHINWQILTSYLKYVQDELINLFLKKWQDKRNGEAWIDSEDSRKYLNEITCKKASDVIKKPMSEWDVTAITKILRSLNSDWIPEGEKKPFEAAAKLRNELFHHSTREINLEKFHTMRKEVFNILASLNVNSTNISQMEQNVWIFHRFSLNHRYHVSPSVSNAEANVNAAFRNDDYAQVIEKSNNVSLKEAEQTKRLQPSCTEPHLRLGDAYNLSEKNEKAITSNDKALSLDLSMQALRTQTDECRQELGPLPRQDHMDNMDMDPLWSPEVMIEQITQKNKEKITQKLQQEYLDVLKKSAPVFAHLFESTSFPFGIDIRVVFETVVNNCSTLSKKGNAFATYVLARLTKKGLGGIEKDIHRALELFKQAAEMPIFLPNHRVNEGVLPAKHCIAMMYYEGVGVEMDSVTAFRWYKDAADLGFGPSANNLAVMYILGKGVPEQDSVKAVQYWKLAAQVKSTRAMHSLAGYYLKTGDAGLARTLFPFAAKGGETLARSRQQEFEDACKALEDNTSKAIAYLEEWEKEKGLSSSKMSVKDRLDRFFRSDDMHNFMEKYYNFRRQIAVSPTRYTNVYECDYSVIAEYASKVDRVYAKQVFKALQHFLSASRSLDNYKKSSDAGEVDSVIKEAARCFATAEYVSYFGKEDRNLLMKLVEQKLNDLKDQICDRDRCARQCYAFLQLPSYKECVSFLKECIARYPEDQYFLNVLACTHGNLEQNDEGKKVAQNGLDLCPKDSQLIGSKACSAIDGNQYKAQEASDLLNNYKESPDAGKVDSVIKEAARCFATAEYSASYFGDEDRNLLMKLVEQKLTDLKDQICEMNRYARQCYAFLQLPSYKKYVTFLKECIARYPTDPYFYDVLACTYGYLEQYDEGKKVAQNGLDLCPEDNEILGSKVYLAIDRSQDKEQKASDLFPKNFELMYNRAYLTFLAFDGDKGMQDVIHCYETFLKYAPSDHRKVPEAYYSMALLTLTKRSQNNDASIEEKVRAYYDKGLESEKQLLPCFLPYEDLSKTKGAVCAYLDTKAKNLKISEKYPSRKPPSSVKSVRIKKESNVCKKNRRTDPVRVQVIRDHRKSIRDDSSNEFDSTIATTINPTYAQCAPPILDGLKRITILEMNPMTSKMYEGHYIEVFIIDEPGPTVPSVSVVLQDTRGDVMRGYFYNLVDNDNINKIKYGAKISIKHPYMEVFAGKEKPAIRVDDPKLLRFDGNHPSDSQCRSCSERKAAMVQLPCTGCKKAVYCNKKCRTHDLEILMHICNQNQGHPEITNHDYKPLPA